MGVTLRKTKIIIKKQDNINLAITCIIIAFMLLLTVLIFSLELYRVYIYALCICFALLGALNILSAVLKHLKAKDEKMTLDEAYGVLNWFIREKSSSANADNIMLIEALKLVLADIEAIKKAGGKKG